MFKNFHLWRDFKKRPVTPAGLVPAPQGPNIGGKVLPSRIQAEPFEGYRTWRVRLDDEGQMGLWGLIQHYEWAEVNTADCKAGRFPPHPRGAPAPDCSCGFYTLAPNSPVTEWDTHTRGRVRASGQAALYGRVIVCAYGYKAEHADIISPVFIDVDCRGQYDKGGCDRAVVEIQVGGGSSDFWGNCPDHQPEREDAVLVDAVLWMRTCLAHLEKKYPNVEFLTFMPLEE